MPLFETGSTIEGAGGGRIISSFLDILLQGACEASMDLDGGEVLGLLELKQEKVSVRRHKGGN